MAISNKNKTFKELFGIPPIMACITCLLTGLGVAYTITSKYDDDHQKLIEKLYEFRIKNIEENCKKGNPIKEITIDNDEKVKYFLNIDTTTKLGKDFNKRLKNFNNGK